MAVLNSPATKKPLRLLMIEDSENDAALTLLQLQRGGLSIFSRRVETAEALKRELEENEWDFIITDYALPQFTGKMALDVVRAHGIDIPFIIVSGSLGEDIAVEMMRAGAHDFFPKGNLTRLAQAIEREVREAEVRRMRDSERTRAEEERQRLLGELREAVRARDTFLALAAHELRTPLTSAQLKLDRLRRMVEQPPSNTLVAELTSSLGFISRQQRKLTALIDNLMEVAAITSGQTSGTRQAVNLKDEVSDALAFHHDEMRASGSTVTINGDPEIVGNWERTRIMTALRNLLSNAFKYGAGKPIDIDISRVGDRARVVVTDRGVGIGKDEQARIFDKFEHAVPEHHHGGFGLGLWIVRRVVEEHGGAISVTSGEGQGSKFIIELPLAGNPP